MLANDVEDDKKVNVFLAVISPNAYKLLKKLCDPDNPNKKSFTQLPQLLQRHCEPAPIVIAERHKFWTALRARRKRKRVRIRGETEEVGISVQFWYIFV